METHLKNSILWGVVGMLSFLVLLQGYHLLAGEFVGFGTMVGVAVLVCILTAVSAHLLWPKLSARNERP